MHDFTQPGGPDLIVTNVQLAAALVRYESTEEQVHTHWRHLAETRTDLDDETTALMAQYVVMSAAVATAAGWDYADCTHLVPGNDAWIDLLDTLLEAVSRGQEQRAMRGADGLE